MHDAPQDLADGGWSWHARLGLPLVLAFAFSLAFYSGTRGIFPFDQSIVFDGGYRVYSGQVPYRDFYAPYGPVVFWFQAALFRVVGVNWYAHALGAAILNAVGAGCSFVILRVLCRRESRLPLLGAVLTSAWLYAPFGTTYPEQTAFCTVLVGLALILPAVAPSCAVSRSPLLSSLLLMSAGVCSMLGVLSKHNAGLPALGIYAAAILAMQLPKWKRSLGSLAIFALGGVLTILAFAGWLWAFSDPSAFIHYVITIPKEIGMERLTDGGIRRCLGKVLTGKGNDVLRILVFAWGLLFSWFAGASCMRRPMWDESRRQGFVAAVLGLALIAVQNVFSLVSSNNGANEKPFLGILFALVCATYQRMAAEFAPTSETAGPSELRPPSTPAGSILALLGVALALTIWSRSSVPMLGTILAVLFIQGLGGIRWPQPENGGILLRWRIRPQRAAFVMPMLFGYLLFAGVTSSVYRLVQDFRGSTKAPKLLAILHHARFERQLSSPGLAGLHWGEPTMISGQEVSAENMEELLTYLRARPGTFFTFSDFHFLYAALGVPSPQPLLWFHKGLTYPKAYSAALDRQIVSDLLQNNVQTVVMESAAFWGSPDARLEDFPCLKRFITEEFALDRKLGFFHVYQLRSEAAISMRSRFPPEVDLQEPGE